MESLVTRDECRLVQASFAQIEPISDEVAEMFYRRLFELNPKLTSLFQNTDMQVQGDKLMEKLAVAVMGLEDLASLASLVKALGRRHAGYGVHPEDYETAREALLWAVGEGLGPAFDSALRNAWSAAFATISVEMLRATGKAPPS